MSEPIVDKEYLSLLRRVMIYGEQREDRTGVGTTSLFGERLQVDLRDGFPLLQSKKVHFHSVLHELLWFLRGDTNIKYLKDNKVRIWDEWADENGDLGPVYGAQWRGFGGVDQIKELVRGLKESPTSRRHIVSAWNPSELSEMALPPCHMMFQCYVSERRFLDLQMYQRSADIFLGVPFNIASYALLMIILSRVTGLTPRYFTHVFGDVHLYQNHEEQARTQLRRWDWECPRNHWGEPNVSIRGWSGEIDDLDGKFFELEDYSPLPAIKAEVAV